MQTDDNVRQRLPVPITISRRRMDGYFSGPLTTMVRPEKPKAVSLCLPRHGPYLKPEWRQNIFWTVVCYAGSRHIHEVRIRIRPSYVFGLMTLDRIKKRIVYWKTKYRNKISVKSEQVCNPCLLLMARRPLVCCWCKVCGKNPESASASIFTPWHGPTMETFSLRVSAIGRSASGLSVERCPPDYPHHGFMSHQHAPLFLEWSNGPNNTMYYLLPCSHRHHILAFPLPGELGVDESRCLQWRQRLWRPWDQNMTWS